MDFKTLLRKHQALLAENQALKEENLSLKSRLGLAKPLESQSSPEEVKQEPFRSEPSFYLNDGANPTEKIRLFMSLFKGREDVYAKRWEGKEGRAGYAPVCLNEWKPGFCKKPQVKCTFCKHKSYAPLDDEVVEAHLRGNLVAGIYPPCQDEKCHFLAMDFDKDGWQQDVSTLRDVCTAFGEGSANGGMRFAFPPYGLVRERLAAEVVIKTDGWQGYSFLDATPGVRHEWLVPGSGKEAPKVLPWVHTLIANIKGNIRGVHHGVSPKHLSRYLAEFCYRFNRRF